jgi:ketosteroid isomerase-like protein
MSASTAEAADLELLQRLNLDYISAVQAGDVPRFEQLLAAEFYCSNPDGTLVDRRGFLRQTAQPVTIKNLTAEDVLIQRFGDIAIIHGRTTYRLLDGRLSSGRYTDVWARQQGVWKTVSAHVTRIA